MLFGKIIGSTASIPTKYRSSSCIFLNLGRECCLLDAGEGCQQKLMLNDLSLLSINFITISHFHEDHYLGLFGLLATMKFLNRTQQLDIYVSETIKYEQILTILHPKGYGFTINLIKIIPEVEYIRADCKLIFERLAHSIINYGVHVISLRNIKYNEEFGKLSSQERANLIKTNVPAEYVAYSKPSYILSYSGDTVFIKEFVEKYADGLLIHECTFFENEDVKVARLKKHTHIKDFKEINKIVLLTHLPAKNKNFKSFLDKKNIFYAKDNTSFKINWDVIEIYSENLKTVNGKVTSQ